MFKMRRLIAVAALPAVLSGCLFDNSARIEQERRRQGMESRLVQAEDDLRRVQASCQDIERALNQERDARAAFQQRLAAVEKTVSEPAKPVAAAKPVSVNKPAPEKPDTAEGRLTGEAAAVARIQAALRKAGYDPGLADGKMGNRTRQALMAFQKDNGLKPDGVLGPKTLSKLQDYLGREEGAPKP